MLNVTKPSPLIPKSSASYVFWPETEYRCSDQCTQLKSSIECAKFGPLVQIDAPAGSCDYYEHGGQTDWKMPVTACLTTESAGYAENPSKQGFGCKRCVFFDADSLDCYRGIDPNSPGPTPGIIHPNACCNFEEPDEVRGKMTREKLVTYFEGQTFSEAARLTGLSDMDPRAARLLKEADAATGLSQSDVCATLRDCLTDTFPGQYCWLRDVYGDDKSGEVVYSCGDDSFKASYAIGTVDGKRQCSIQTSTAVQVLPKTTYDTVTEAAKPKEAAAAAPATLKLFESAATLETIVLKEAKADYGIKLIAPGKGSSAFYPKEVLERDGPKVFKAGTHVYLNHPTAAEEASRPEGDVKNLAGVLTTSAVYNESGASGPGLYARMKVFADHAQTVEEKAPHVGMSIRASGIAESGKSKDGLPVLKELTSAESVDVVTKAGAGGMILQESAVQQTTVKEGEMTPDEVKKLVESGIAEATKPLVESNRALRQRALAFDAREEGERLLETVTLPEEAKAKIIREAVRSIPLTESGELDLKKFSESIVELAKTEGAYLAKITRSGKVFGMGPTIVTESDEKAQRKAEKKRLKEAKRLKESGRDAFEALGMPKDAAKIAAMRGVA